MMMFSGARHSSGASSGPRASSPLMSAQDARGPHEHERHWSGALP
ncbi:MAG: hypothetical protein OJF58_001989 [Enhydrobacter sp.]|nr:MAG: hypothetical protein OJF58_001989 [Enhydrobacter sp.]